MGVSHRDSRRGRLLSFESIAGWVFADLLLVLFVVGLASAVPVEPPPVPEAVEKATAKPKPKPKIVGMKTEPVTATIGFDAQALVSPGGTAKTQGRSVCRTIRGSSGSIDGERAALVLIFGGAPEAATGQRVATAVGEQLTCANKELFPRGTPFRSFWDGSLPLGKARLEVFVFTTKQSAPRT
jgi:hypothetical protein